MTQKFETESIAIQSVLESEELVEIQLIQETEALLELLVLVTPDEYIQSYVRPMMKIGYTFIPEKSSIVKLFFQKGESIAYSLYLSQAN